MSNYTYKRRNCQKLADNISLAFVKGKTSKQEREIARLKILSNPFAQNAIQQKNAYYESIENSKPLEVREREKRLENELKEWMQKTIGKKGGIYAGFKDYNKFGIKKYPINSVLNTPSFFRIALNCKSVMNALILDIDRPWSLVDWKECGLPEPSFITYDRVLKPTNAWNEKEIKNYGKCHMVYLLSFPIYQDSKNWRAISYANAIYKAFRRKIDSDIAYTNHLTKNPFNTYSHNVIWHSGEHLKTYELHELENYVVLGKFTEIEKIVESAVNEGRNNTIFNNVRQKAYQLVKKFAKEDKFYQAVYSLAEDVRNNAPNSNFEFIDDKELSHIVKSIVKFSWNRFKRGLDTSSFIDYSSEEGRQKAELRRQHSQQIRQAKQAKKLDELKTYLLTTIKDKNMQISVSKLAKQFNIERKKVKKLLDELGIESTDRATYLTEADRKRKTAYEYRQEGLKYKEIAEKMNCSEQVAKNLVKKYKELNKIE